MTRKPFRLPKKIPTLHGREVLALPVHVDMSKKSDESTNTNGDHLNARWRFLLTLGSYSSIWSQEMEAPDFFDETKRVIFENLESAKL